MNTKSIKTFSASNMKIFVIFIFLPCLFSFCTNSKNNLSHSINNANNDTVYFDFDLLKSDLEFTTLYSENNDTNIYYASKDEIYKTILNDSNLFSKDTSMSFYNKEYEIDSLMLLINSGFFNFNNCTYYYFFYSNFYYNCGQCPYLLSLYEYNSKTRMILNIPIGYQASGIPSCFGDFNNDKILDFVLWDFSDSVKFYSYEEEKKIFSLKTDYYLILDEIFFNKYAIIKSKSKWFNAKIFYN